MAKNFVQPGEVVEVTAPAAVSSGDPVLVGNLFGIALTDAASGASVEIARAGVWTINKDTALAINEGDRVFWDAANAWVDKTVTAQQNVGVCIEDALTAAATCQVLLGSAVASGF